MRGSSWLWGCRLFLFSCWDVGLRCSCSRREKGKEGALRALFPAPGYFIALARRLVAAAFHQFVEGFEIGARLSGGKEFRCLQGGKFFGQGGGGELVDAGAIFLALEIDRPFQRDWEAQGIGFCLCIVCSF